MVFVLKIYNDQPADHLTHTQNTFGLFPLSSYFHFTHIQHSSSGTLKKKSKCILVMCQVHQCNNAMHSQPWLKNGEAVPGHNKMESTFLILILTYSFLGVCHNVVQEK